MGGRVQHGDPKVLDRYGAKDPAEFFAVASETFFEKAGPLRVRHPDLYAVLADYYHQDPAGREWAAAGDRADVGRTPYRGSRAVTKTAAGRRVTLSWPGWVTGVWDLHPGVPREYARRPFGHLGTMAVSTAVVSGIFWWVTGGWNAAVVVSLGLFATSVALAVWLWLAVRWVDRNGVWAGRAVGEAPAPASDDTPTVA